jgi:hypothetical protein
MAKEPGERLILASNSQPQDDTKTHEGFVKATKRKDTYRSLFDKFKNNMGVRDAQAAAIAAYNTQIDSDLSTELLTKEEVNSWMTPGDRGVTQMPVEGEVATEQEVKDTRTVEQALKKRHGQPAAVSTPKKK